MQSFYSAWSDLVLAANALVGTGAFLVLLGGQDTFLATILTGIVAGASAIGTIYKPAEKAKLHMGLYRSFTELAAEMETIPPDQSSLARIRAERLKIEMDDPPVHRLVDLIAYNEEARCRGISCDHFWPLSPWQKKFGYFADFGLERLDKWHNEKGLSL